MKCEIGAIGLPNKVGDLLKETQLQECHPDEESVLHLAKVGRPGIAVHLW